MTLIDTAKSLSILVVAAMLALPVHAETQDIWLGLFHETYDDGDVYDTDGAPVQGARFDKQIRVDTAPTLSYHVLRKGDIGNNTFGIRTWLVGTIADRPAAGTSGRFYFATDLNAASYDNGSTWQDFTDVSGASITSGVFASRPATSSASEGDYYYATDTGVMFYFNGTSWEQTTSWNGILVGGSASRPDAEFFGRFHYAGDLAYYALDNGTEWIPINIWSFSEAADRNEPVAGFFQLHFSTDTQAMSYSNGYSWSAIGGSGVTDHGALTGLSDDDHTQYFHLTQDETVSGRPGFVGGTTGVSSPFTVDSTYVVTNLNADLLDGASEAAYAKLADNEVVSGEWDFEGAEVEFNPSTTVTMSGAINGTYESITLIGAASASAAPTTAYLTPGLAMSATRGVVVPKAGSVVGLSVQYDCTSSGTGDAFVVVIGGNEDISESAAGGVASDLKEWASYTRGTYPFTAGEVISLAVKTNSGTFTIDDYSIQLRVVYN